MLSIFFINFATKTVNGSRKPKDIFPQLDAILPRFVHLTKGLLMWQDEKVNQDSIGAQYSEDNLEQLTFRFDLDNLNQDFREKIIAFCDRNELKLAIKQDIVFDPQYLSDDLINLNEQRFYRLDDPIAFLVNQREIDL